MPTNYTIEPSAPPAPKRLAAPKSIAELLTVGAPPTNRQPHTNHDKMKDKIYTGAILALDQASAKTGYAIYKNGQIVKSGTWKLKQDYRFADLSDRLDVAITKYDITQIVAEDIYKDADVRKDKAFMVLAECRGIVKMMSQYYNLPAVVFISPIRAKQYTWGMAPRHSGMERKEQKACMIRAVQRKGFTLKNDRADDEADAIGILLTYLSNHDYTITSPSR